MEEKQIPYIVYEAAEARADRRNRRLIVVLILSIILLFASNAIWLYAWCQYDYSSEESIIEQNADDGGNANYIGNDGEINNGIPKNND